MTKKEGNTFEESASKSSQDPSENLSDAPTDASSLSTTSNYSNITADSASSSRPRSRSRSFISRTRSSASQGISIHEPELPASHVLYDLEAAQVIEKVKELETNVKRVIVENRVFQSFLEEHEPEILSEKPTGHKKVSIAGVARSIIFAKSFTTRESLGNIARAQPAREVIKINITQKSDLVLRNMEGRQADAARTKKRLYRQKCKLIAQMEEVENRKEELELSLQSFEEFYQSHEPITLAKFIRFMDEWIKASRLTADKLRLRHSSLKVQFQKLLSVLTHKQMVGENLQEIDFEQIKIENVHLEEKIEKKTLLLLELKKMTGEANLKLTQHKQILQDRVREKEAIVEAIKRVEKDVGKADDEIMKTYPELNKVKRGHKKWKERIEKYVAPEVLEYVRKKAEVDVLRKDLKVWSRRNTIKNSALSIEVGEMKKLLHCRKVHSSWFE